MLTAPFGKKVTDNVPLYVYKGCAENFKSAEGWKEFRNIVETDVSGIPGVESDNSLTMRVENGVLLIEGNVSDEVGVEVYSADGSLIYSGRNNEISVPRGVLIVRCGNEVQKIVN